MRKASATVTTTAKARISESPKNRQMPSWSVITLMRLCAPHKVRCSCGDATIAWGFFLIGFKSNNWSLDASNASCRAVNAVSKTKALILDGGSSNAKSRTATANSYIVVFGLRKNVKQ